jgi:hypothetical protein
VSSKLLAAACAAIVCLAGARATAFCRTTTCDPNVDCEYDSAGCTVNGEALFWGSTCVSFGVQAAGSAKRGIRFDTAHDLIAGAFEKWAGVDCASGGPEIEIADLGDLECRTAEYNQAFGNANIWMFRDRDWPYEGPNATLALTIITYNPDTGEIYDADIEVNSWGQDVTVGDTDVEADLESIVTHESGHFLGLSHSRALGSTMIAGYTTGTTDLRTLGDDDVAGMCRIYDPDDAPSSSSCVPRHGFSAQCADAQESGGCRLGRGHSPKSAWGALFALGALALRCRRRRL